MIRKIIKIDNEKCTGCGICADACHEGAIGIIDGKARLLREDYCDGLGDCLPACPENAISFEEREALAYNEDEVKKAKKETSALPCGCPGSNARAIEREKQNSEQTAEYLKTPSRLSQWPVQIKLVSPNAAYFDGADLLIAADCTAFAYGSFHEDFIKDKICIIGCPKLDSVDYAEKLAAVITHNGIKSVTVVRMEVPCCGGIEYAAKQAVEKSGKNIPCKTVIISTDGKILN